jgi:hypothetical protein
LGNPDWEKQPRWNLDKPRYKFRANDIAARSEFFILFLFIPNLWVDAITHLFSEDRVLAFLFAKNLTRYYYQVFKEVRRIKRSRRY